MSDFKSKVAEALLEMARILCDDEQDAAMHLGAALCALCPNREVSLGVINHISDEADKVNWN